MVNINAGDAKSASSSFCNGEYKGGAKAKYKCYTKPPSRLTSCPSKLPLEDAVLWDVCTCRRQFRKQPSTQEVSAKMWDTLNRVCGEREAAKAAAAPKFDPSLLPPAEVCLRKCQDKTQQITPVDVANCIGKISVPADPSPSSGKKDSKNPQNGGGSLQASFPELDAVFQGLTKCKLLRETPQPPPAPPPSSPTPSSPKPAPPVSSPPGKPGTFVIKSAAGAAGAARLVL